jgi:hypothetical protein
LVSGDFNNDTKLDLAVTNYDDNTVGILLGNGDGSFQSQTTIPVGSDPTSLILGDFNGDTRLDLATVDSLSDELVILLNQCSVTTD